MSTTVASHKTLAARVVQLLALLVTFALLFFVTRLNATVDDSVSTVLAVGFLLLAGTLMSEVLETVGLPHLTGYLLAGILGGPHVAHLVDHETVLRLTPVNTLALALIALAGGCELRIAMLQRTFRSLAWATLIQSAIVLVFGALAFMAAARFIPFTHDYAFAQLLGVALLWGVLAVSRSPSAVLGILTQTRASGPLANFSLAFVMLSDVVVVTLLAVVLMVVHPLISGGGTLSFDDFSVLGHELMGSVAVGTTLGLALAVYLRLVGKQLLLVLMCIGFGLTEALRYIHVDPLLTFLTAGFVVQNMSRQGTVLLNEIEKVSSVVFVVFFATAGAHLDLALLRSLWPVACALCAARALGTFVAARLSSHVAQDGPTVRRFGFAPLISQAGLTLGLSVMIERSFPMLAGSFQSLVIATVALNEMVGPVLFKVALDRSGESASDREVQRDSLLLESNGRV